ncbi:MAG: flavodoxin family protein, partial [Alcaligenaceae bacterium]|nr:flavodoxin family protein [Alcaligenaceae bacterium]
MDANTKTLLIIWHSRTNAAKQAAQAAFESACKVRQELEQSHDIVMVNASEVSLNELQQASAYLFCAPENLASLSGAMKEFFDRFYYDLLENIEGRPYSA